MKTMRQMGEEAEEDEEEEAEEFLANGIGRNFHLRNGSNIYHTFISMGVCVISRE
jgi:hypothetical protein